MGENREAPVVTRRMDDPAKSTPVQAITRQWTSSLTKATITFVPTAIIKYALQNINVLRVYISKGQKLVSFMIIFTF